MNVKFLKEKVERKEAFEQKIGIEIKNISFALSSICEYVECYFEVHSIGGGAIDQSCTIDVVVYDTEGDIIYTNSQLISSSEFAGFEVLSISLLEIDESNIAGIDRILIYPKL